MPVKVAIYHILTEMVHTGEYYVDTSQSNLTKFQDILYVFHGSVH